VHSSITIILNSVIAVWRLSLP